MFDFCHRFIDPLFFGDYPRSMRSRVGRRLPKFSKIQAALVKGSLDFVGINHYTSNYAMNFHIATNNSLSDHYYTDSGALMTRRLTLTLL